MEQDLKRQLVYGLLNLLLGLLAAWLAKVLTDRLLGNPKEKPKLTG